MKIDLIILILNLVLLLINFLVFLKYKKAKKDLIDNIVTINNEPEIFLDFFAK